MTKFNNEAFRALVDDLLNDTFYVEGRSNRGKIATIRQYSEILVRKVLDYSHEEYVTLGKRDITSKLKANSNNNPLLMVSIDEIKGIGNDCTHSQAIENISDEDVEKALESLFNLYSYLFVAYFEKNKFGINKRITSSFSILPPIIRFTTLNSLYNNSPENLDVIDKLVLAILKAFDESKALEWVEGKKHVFVDMSSVSKEGAAALKIEHGEVVSNIIINNAPNMYDLCIGRIKTVSDIIECNGLLYNDFESAMPLYLAEGKVQGDAPEIIEFNALMEFIYLGRKPKENDRLDNIEAYSVCNSVSS